MEEIAKVAVALFMVIGLPMLSIFVLPPIAKAWARRLDSRSGPASEELAAELADLRERVGEMSQLQGRLTELEDRLDFTERLLAQRREADRLPGRANQ